MELETHKRVGWVFFTISMLGTFVAIVAWVSGADVKINSVFILIPFSVYSLFTIKFSKLKKSLVFLCIGYGSYYIFTNPGEFPPVLVYSVGWALAFEYGMLLKHFVKKSLLLMAIFLSANITSALLHQSKIALVLNIAVDTLSFYVIIYSIFKVRLHPLIEKPHQKRVFYMQDFGLTVDEQLIMTHFLNHITAKEIFSDWETLMVTKERPAEITIRKAIQRSIQKMGFATSEEFWQATGEYDFK